MSEIIETYQEERELEEPFESDSAFATIVSVDSDGAVVIFDGEEEASIKKYPYNSSAKYHIGERVFMQRVDGNYIVSFPVCGEIEDIDDKIETHNVDISAHPLIRGLISQKQDLLPIGQAGQVLTKTNDGVAWRGAGTPKVWIFVKTIGFNQDAGATFYGDYTFVPPFGHTVVAFSGGVSVVKAVVGYRLYENQAGYIRANQPITVEYNFYNAGSGSLSGNLYMWFSTISADEPVVSNISITSIGNTSTNSSVAGAYIKIDGVTYTSGSINVNPGMIVEIYAKSAEYRRSVFGTSYYTHVGCRVDGETVGRTSSSTSAYVEMLKLLPTKNYNIALVDYTKSDTIDNTVYVDVTTI